jgi:hypothetical protein
MQSNTPKEVFKQIQVGFRLLFIFPVIILTLFYMLAFFQLFEATYSDASNTIFIVLLGVCLLIIPGMFMLSKSRIKRIERGNPLIKKLQDYRDFMLWIYLSFEFCLIFSAFYYLLTANDFIFILAASLLILMLTFKPNKEKLANELGLNQKERIEME